MEQWWNDIWKSYRGLPGWVQIWVGLILMPMNAIPIFWIGAPTGCLVALLAIGGMLPNLFLLVRDRTFGPAMSVSHLIFWPPLLLLALWLLNRTDVTGSYRLMLWALLIVDLISLGFDVLDARKWSRGRQT